MLAMPDLVQSSRLDGGDLLRLPQGVQLGESAVGDVEEKLGRGW